MRRALLPLMFLEVGLAAAEAAAPAALGPDSRFDGVILACSERARLNPRFVKAVIMAESEFLPTASSPRGAKGLMQLLPETAEEMGVAREELALPEPNIRAGTAYLDRLYLAARLHYGLRAKRLHDAPTWVQRRVLAAYNGGPRLLARTRDRWPCETRCYVDKVMLASRSRSFR